MPTLLCVFMYEKQAVNLILGLCVFDVHEIAFLRTKEGKKDESRIYTFVSLCKSKIKPV